MPTASSITVLPAALRLINGARTKENLLAAFAALNPGISASIPKAQCTSATDTACISDVAVALFNLRNPVTGDFVIARAPRGHHDGRQRRGRDWVCGRQPARAPAQRCPGRVPAGPSYTLKLDGADHQQPAVERHALLREFPRLRSVSGSLVAGIAVHARARRSERHVSRPHTTGCSGAGTRSTRFEAAVRPAQSPAVGRVVQQP